MKTEEINALNSAIDAVQSLIAAYNVVEWSKEAIQFSIVVDALLEVGDMFIPESKAGEVIDEIIKARNEGVTRKRKCRSLRYKINQE